MNKMIKGLLLAAMTLSAAHVHAASNKTFLAPRPVGMDLAMESVTFGEVCNSDNSDRFGGNFEITGFYSKSSDNSKLGEYFSPTGNSSFSAKTNTAAATNSVATPPTGADINAGLVVYDNAGGYNTNATISYSPSQEVYGAKFSYHQSLDKVLEGLYFRVKLPVVHVKNAMGISVSNSANATMTADLSNFFNGTLSTTPAAVNGATRNQLVNALIDGKSHGKTAVADLALELGYTFLDKETYKAALNLGLIIPTGNTAKGQYAFEPVGGNGGHVGLGLGYEFAWRIWGDEHTNIKFNSSLDWRYLFEATETRTFGIVPGTFPQGFGQYAVTTPSAADVALTTGSIVTNPLANASTLNTKVTPGNIVDGIAGFTVNYGGLTVDLGYNLFYKESDSISHDAITDGANRLFISCNQALNASSPTLTTGTEVVNLTNALLDNDSAASASQFSNKIYGGVGYIFKDMEYPINVAVGGHYEIAANNATVENWGIHVKSGISF